MDQSLEEWRPVVGYEGFFEVSSIGRVRSLERVVLRSNGSPQMIKGRIRKLREDNHGYVVMVLRKAGHRARTRKVHHLVLEAFVGPANGLHCRHLDGCKTNNRVENLCYGTRKENEHDKLFHGTRAAGERHARSKLTDEAVRFIIKNPRVKNSELAAHFKVDPSAISNVRRGCTWRHVSA